MNMRMIRILVSQCSVLALTLVFGAADVLPQTLPAPAAVEPACKSCRDTKRCRTCNGSGEQKCSHCHGKRKVEERCTRCGGDGRKSERRRMGRRTVTRSSTCSSCSGKGKKESDCTRCGRDGRVTCNTCRGKKHCPTCFVETPVELK